jgi:hypothetical protein
MGKRALRYGMTQQQQQQLMCNMSTYVILVMVNDWSIVNVIPSRLIGGGKITIMDDVDVGNTAIDDGTTLPFAYVIIHIDYAPNIHQQGKGTAKREEYTKLRKGCGDVNSVASSVNVYTQPDVSSLTLTLLVLIIAIGVFVFDDSDDVVIDDAYACDGNNEARKATMIAAAAIITPRPRPPLLL